MNKVTSLAVVGAGLIGKRHIDQIRAESQAKLHAIVDPSAGARAFATERNAAWFPSFADMLRVGRPDGVIIATPNQLHVSTGLEAIAAKLPCLIEKPLADDLEGATALVKAADEANLPLLTGHHRRHNPIIQRAKDIIDSGRLGRLVTVHAFFWLMKPDDYFDVSWRREAGAGPMLLNFIHDIDLLRYLCGEVDTVQAFQSNAIRGYPVDETTVVALRFENGVLGTVNVTDTAVAPWSWEQTTGENPMYPHTDQSCYFFAGTKGALSVPRLELWSNETKPSWWNPFQVERVVVPAEDPLRLQIRQFCRVIQGSEVPLVSGHDGFLTLKVSKAVQRATKSGTLVRVADV